MTRFPKITVQKWTSEGPAYTVHRPLEGRLNRHRRRAGETDDEQVGPHDLDAVDTADGSMVFAKGDDELWAFAQGHVYELEVLVDGSPAVIHVDARDGHKLESFVKGVQLVARKALTDDELAELLDDIEDPNDEASQAEPEPIEPDEDLIAELEAIVDDASEDDEDAVGGDSGKSDEEEE